MADAAFARSMASGMKSYEAAASPLKQKIFTELLAPDRLRDGAVVVELGLGTFPNARYYADALQRTGEHKINNVCMPEGADQEEFLQKMMAEENANKVGTTPAVCSDHVHIT